MNNLHFLTFDIQNLLSHINFVETIQKTFDRPAPRSPVPNHCDKTYFMIMSFTMLNLIQGHYSMALIKDSLCKMSYLNTVLFTVFTLV